MGSQWEKMSDWEGYPNGLDFFLIPLVNFITGGGGGVGKKNQTTQTGIEKRRPQLKYEPYLLNATVRMSVTSDSLRLHDAMAEAASRWQHGGSFSENRLRVGSGLLHTGCLIIPHLPP